MKTLGRAILSLKRRLADPIHSAAWSGQHRHGWKRAAESGSRSVPQQPNYYTALAARTAGPLEEQYFAGACLASSTTIHRNSTANSPRCTSRTSCCFPTVTQKRYGKRRVRQSQSLSTLRLNPHICCIHARSMAGTAYTLAISTTGPPIDISSLGWGSRSTAPFS